MSVTRSLATPGRPDQVRYYVYVWEFPVRLFHWTNALCVAVLAVTGYLIGNPPALVTAAEPWQAFMFGKIRFVHFVTAWIWISVAFLRLYWGLVGNEYVRYRNFIPTSRQQWRDVGTVLRVDVLQTWRGATESIGHNPLAAFTYTLMFGAFLFQVFTGFGMYSAMSQSWFAGLFAWVIPLFGGDHAVRLWHHMAMWGFVIFTIVHVYLAAYHDYVEATGTISSMVGGWKFVHRKHMPKSLRPLQEADRDVARDLRSRTESKKIGG